MSTVFSEDLSAIAEGEFGIVRQPSMPIPKDRPIAAYILSVMADKNYKAAKVLAIAKRLKLGVSRSNFQQIYSGLTANPGIYTLADISKALDRPFEEMVNAAFGGSVLETASFKKSRFAVLAELYERLQGKEQKIADRFLDMLERELHELITQQDENNQSRRK